MEIINRLFIETTSAARYAWASLRPQPSYAMVTRSRRGAGLLEYALLLALAVILFFFIRRALVGNVSGIMSKVDNGVSGTDSCVKNPDAAGC